jgi:peptidoglycan/LPS O-acetylase OafA/YrhL
LSSEPAKTPLTVSAPLFVPTMHGIRGVAVLTVVLFHIAGAALWVPSHDVPRALYESAGPFALDLLCFTTGFVLFLPVVLKGGFGSLRAFVIRRFARMAPPYYVCLLLVLVLFPLLSDPAIVKAADRGLGDLLIHIGFLQRELSPVNQGFIVNSPLWSLSVDFAFYLLLPLIASTYLRHPLIGLAIAITASAVWRAAFIDPHVVAASQATDMLRVLIQPPLFLADFASGMTAAWAFLRLRDRDWARLHPRLTVAAALGALAAMLVLAYVGGSSLPYHLAVFQDPAAVRVLLPLALLVFVVAAALAPAWAQRPLTNRPLSWLAEISYSVYLYHFPVIFFGIFTIGISRDGSFPWLWMAAVLPSVIAIGTLSYFLVELPARGYGRRVARRFARSERSEPASPAPARVT